MENHLSCYVVYVFEIGMAFWYDGIVERWIKVHFSTRDVKHEAKQHKTNLEPKEKSLPQFQVNMSESSDP